MFQCFYQQLSNPLVPICNDANLFNAKIFCKFGRDFHVLKYNSLWAVGMAQLVQQLFLPPEVHGSNPVIGKNLFLNICLLLTM